MIDRLAHDDDVLAQVRALTDKVNELVDAVNGQPAYTVWVCSCCGAAGQGDSLPDGWTGVGEKVYCPRCGVTRPMVVSHVCAHCGAKASGDQVPEGWALIEHVLHCPRCRP